MAIVKINWKPTDQQLRGFGISSVVALPLMGWIGGCGVQVVNLLAAVGLLLAVAGIVIPQVLKPIYITLAIVAAPLGIVLGELALLAVYFCVFLPTGLIFRIMKRDALQRKFDHRAVSYWQPKKRPKDVAGYYRRF